MRTHRSVDDGEVAADEYVAIPLQRHGMNTSVRSRARIETRIQIAIRIEPGDTIAGRAVDGGEIAADQNFSVWLQRDGSHRAVSARTRNQICVHTPVFD